MGIKSLKQQILRRLKSFFLFRKIQDLNNFLVLGDIIEGLGNFRDKKCLVLSPHPDDESIGCGGTLKLITMSGGLVDVMYMTKGEFGAMPPEKYSDTEVEEWKQRRVAEAEVACKILGVRRILYLPGKDTELHLQPELHEHILAVINNVAYDYVFCPWPFDAHSDHVATFNLLKESMKKYQGKIAIWLYEVWNPLIANRIVRIDGTMETKLEAIRAHTSQLDSINYTDKFIGLAKYRSLYIPNAQYAEAFLTTDAERLSTFQVKKAA